MVSDLLSSLNSVLGVDFSRFAFSMGGVSFSFSVGWIVAFWFVFFVIWFVLRFIRFLYLRFRDPFGAYSYKRDRKE